MEETIWIFKALPYLIYVIGFVLAITSGALVYSGLSTQTERMQTRLRIKQSIQNNNIKLQKSASNSGAEDWLRKAGYPLGLNAFKYYLFLLGLVILLLLNYVAVPLSMNSTVNLWILIAIVIGIVLALPFFPYSLFVYAMKRIVDYRQAKKNAEIFMLYDLLIKEIDMMNNSRINTYNVFRNIKPYFDVISDNLIKMLSVWSNDEGPDVALERFAEEMGTKEAKSLVSVIKTLDEVDRETALDSLKGMNDMFVRSQIENYRRRRKITTDLSSIPIKITHFLIIFNFLMVIVVMVMKIMSENRGY